MPTFCGTPEEYRLHCVFWGMLERLLAVRYSDIPWIFESAYESELPGRRWVVTFQTFDGAKHLTVTWWLQNGENHFTFSDTGETVTASSLP